jgi:twitching motility protein PilJ
MTGILSKMKVIRGMSVRSNSPGNTPVLVPVLKYLQISRQTWIFGITFVLFLLITLIMLRADAQHTRNHLAYMKIIGGVHIHAQRLAIASQETLRGDGHAFAQLRDSLDQLNHYLSLLQRGGQYRGQSVSALVELIPVDLFQAFQSVWRIQENKILLLLESQEQLVRLAEIVRQIDATNTRLQKSLQELWDKLTQTGYTSNQAATIETKRILAQAIAGNIGTLLQGEIQVSSVADQLTRKQDRITLISTVLMNQRDLLLSSIPEDHSSSEIALQPQAQFNALENLLQLVQKLLPEVAGSLHAAQDIFAANEAFLQPVRRIEQAIQEHNDTLRARIKVFIYSAAVLAVITFLVFIQAFFTSLRKQMRKGEKGIENTQKAILCLLNEIEKPASGDLTARMSVTEDITGAIADSINLTIEELQALVKKVNQASSQVIDASLQAEQVSSDLLTAAQNQTHKIEDTTVAVLGVAESLEEVSASVEECAGVAKQSLHAAESGASAVQDAMAGMNEIRIYIQETAKRIKRLGESSQEIGEIVTLISDITEQTNILALNAAIQAASAGEAGKGFSVIAQEIQRLAEHSTEATKQISTLIRNIRGDTQDTIIAMERSTAGVVEGARRANATGDALEEIEEVSKRLAQLVSKISEVTRTQTLVTNKVAKNMEVILSITRQTTQGTSQNAGSVKQIAGYATELKASVSNFKV